MSQIPEAQIAAAATAMLTPQMRRILHAAGLEYEPGQDGLMAQFARLGLEAAAPLIAPPDGAVPVYVTMTLAGEGLGNAVISPPEPTDGQVYFTLIGCGDNAEQNAIAAKFVAGFNALGKAPPDGAVEAAVLAEREANAALCSQMAIKHREDWERWNGRLECSSTNSTLEYGRVQGMQMTGKAIRARSASLKPGSGT